MTGRDPFDLSELAQQLRVDAVWCSEVAGSGHPTSSLSAADVAAVLLARHLRYDFARPDLATNDRLILSKGHASPLLYALFRAAGAISDDELATFRALGSLLEGHPTPRLPWVDVATGSLGLGLPAGVGCALAGRRLDRLPYRTWVLCGDGELSEGSMWEAFEHAGHEGLDNLTAIVDVNRLGKHGPTRVGWDTAPYADRIRAFGWSVQEVDGHDLGAIDDALASAATATRPTAVLARTVKGAGVTRVADQEGHHGVTVPEPEHAIVELGGIRHLTVDVLPPDSLGPDTGSGAGSGAGPGRRLLNAHVYEPPKYAVGTDVATRDAFGEAFAALGRARADVVGLDADVADSTRMSAFAEEHPERFFEFHIAEQQMIAGAIGMDACGWRPYAATYASFLGRAHDFIRMASISRSDITVIGSHAGVAIGADGPAQMGLEDMAALRTLHGSTVLHPCDANQTAALVGAMVDQPGICYLRTCRCETPVIYDPGDEFVIGGSRVLTSSNDDVVTIAATGVTVHEALVAEAKLAREGIAVRVIDVYSLKPVDAFTLLEAAAATGCIVTVEDHRPEGGLGDAVLDLFTGGVPPPVVMPSGTCRDRPPRTSSSVRLELITGPSWPPYGRISPSAPSPRTVRSPS